MSKTVVPTVESSNQLLITLLDKKKPFLITRLGWAIGFVTYCYVNHIEYSSSLLNKLQTHDGIYCNTLYDVKQFAQEYLNAIKNSTYLAAFPNFQSSFLQMQNYFINTCALSTLHNRSLEPFWSILENKIPWTHKLFGKKILIVNPFINSMKKQKDNNFQMFKNKKIFLDNQEIIFFFLFNCLAGNRPHNSWKETYEIMCNDIKDLDFDIALLGCGGYGLPLCNFIYKKMNKSAIYIGGGLQLLFGVMGKRWEDNPMWKKIMKESDSIFIRPSGDEILKNNQMIENACYW